LHDVGHQDGIDYLVMECVEGETLAKRLEKGPSPVDQVLKVGAQIADALDKARRSEIVHRDLKPSNIILTPTGSKLLDFGLAKPTSALVDVAAMTATKVETPVTERGTIVGTFQYMSPEQVEGRELDGRSDIFSLGTVLYEMVTGQRAFDGKSRLSVASAILEKEPAPITTLQPLAPAALDHAIRTCLEKDPDNRWQTAREQRIHAEGITIMRELCALTRERMHTMWGGVLGDRLWLWLRGEDFLEPPARPLQTLSRQHILPPDCRTPDKARAVALKLLHSTARKMRRNNLWAGGISLQVGFYDHVAFACNVRIEPCHDPYTLQEHLIAVWSRVPAYTPSDLSVALTHLDLAPSRISSALIRLTNRMRDSV
jgi:serine/threonine protein kinase